MTETIIWCAGCDMEAAVDFYDVECNGDLVSFPLGEVCLTRALENDRIEE